MCIVWFHAVAERRMSVWLGQQSLEGTLPLAVGLKLTRAVRYETCGQGSSSIRQSHHVLPYMYTSSMICNCLPVCTSSYLSCSMFKKQLVSNVTSENCEAKQHAQQILWKLLTEPGCALPPCISANAYNTGLRWLTTPKIYVSSHPV